MTTISIPKALPPTRDERRRAAPARHVDLLLVASTVALAVLGVVLVYSATRGPGGPDDIADRFYLHRQGAFAIIGCGVMAAATLVDYRWFRRLAPAVYVVTLVVLGLVLTPLGSESKGSQAWFQFGTFQFQPSEVGKLGLIITLAAYLSFRKEDLSLRHLLMALAIAGAPIGLIMLQPDLGTVLVFVVITCGMLLIGGAQAKHIVVVTLVGFGALVAIQSSDVLADYQTARLTTFLDPDSADEETRWNVEQSQITLANGGPWGQGLHQGQQTRSDLVPEQQTDFIFTVLGEELGFVGSAAALGLYGIMLWRIWRTAHIARDLFGSLLCVGVFCMILFQVFQSVGMASGIMPVTGLPLPLLSYGGSSTLTTFLALGLVLNVHMRRKVT